MPSELIKALIESKRACAVVNLEEEKLTVEESQAITQACDQLLNHYEDYQEQFPLCLWQTGSGTQTNMNVNEVIAHIASQNGLNIHPNDHVNRSQSSNDIFPTAMNMAAYIAIQRDLLPELNQWMTQLSSLSDQYEHTLKIGRTHLQDATPLTFGQEVSGWLHMIKNSYQSIETASQSLLQLAVGGTAVGTGINASTEFGDKVCAELSKRLGIKFQSDENKFFALTSHQPITYTHGAIRALAADLMKIANDIRWLASGPRCGLGELIIPSNEPGSSIMPGKVNPTQAEALTMVVAQVMGNDTTIQFAASQGNFQLNVYKPVIIHNMMQSIGILTDVMNSFRIHCLQGLTVNQERMNHLLNNSLMLVTAMTPHIGYEKAAEIAKLAHKENTSLKEATLKLDYATSEQVDQWLETTKMI